MNAARQSLFVFGLSMIFVFGIGFMLFPRPLLALLGLTVGDDVWIRFVGMLVSIIGLYYVQVARGLASTRSFSGRCRGGITPRPS